jgi:hypothetical protein
MTPLHFPYMLNTRPNIQKGKSLPMACKPLKNILVTAVRGHTVSLLTLTMAHFASKAPTVSFVHDYPGFVKTNVGREMTGVDEGCLLV